MKDIKKNINTEETIRCRELSDDELSCVLGGIGVSRFEKDSQDDDSGHYYAFAMQNGMSKLKNG